MAYRERDYPFMGVLDKGWITALAWLVPVLTSLTVANVVRPEAAGLGFGLGLFVPIICYVALAVCLDSWYRWTCSDCGGRVRKDAASCPHCGEKLEVRKPWSSWSQDGCPSCGSGSWEHSSGWEDGNFTIDYYTCEACGREDEFHPTH